MGTYLQDAGQRADPLLHVLLTLRGQHEVGDLVHLQLKGVFPQTVVLRGGREGAKTVQPGWFWICLSFWKQDSLHTITILSGFEFGENKSDCNDFPPSDRSPRGQRLNSVPSNSSFGKHSNNTLG